MVEKASSLRRPVSSRRASSFSTASISVELAGRRLAREPGEEARHRGAVAPMRRARARDLGGVLHRLHERDRVGPDIGRPAGALDAADERDGAALGIDPHLRFRRSERFERARQRLLRRDVGDGADGGAGLVRDLRRIEEHRRAPLGRDHRIAERQRRMRDVAAADVEGPGEVVRVRDHERVELRLRELFPDARELRLARLAGKLRRVRPHRRLRRRRPLEPDHVDEVDLDRPRARRRPARPPRSSFFSPPAVWSQGS